MNRCLVARLRFHLILQHCSKLIKFSTTCHPDRSARMSGGRGVEGPVVRLALIGCARQAGPSTRAEALGRDDTSYGVTPAMDNPNFEFSHQEDCELTRVDLASK